MTALDPLDILNEKLPKRDQSDEKIGEHDIDQAEKLLSEPIMIPRNPIALNVRFIVVALIADVLLALGIGLMLMALTGLHTTLSGGLIIFILLVIFCRFLVLGFALFKMSAHWSQETYLITERQLIHRRGIVNSHENTYELANIRNVYVFQDFLGRMYDYGHIKLNIATRGYEEEIRLTDLKNPSHYKTVFEKYLG